MVNIFAFFVCVGMGAPWWVFIIGFICLLADAG